jgi:hypothetical protein
MNSIDELFADYFRHWEIRLPTEALQSRQSGEIRAHGWTIQYQFNANERGVFLDFYVSHRMTNDRHMRIFESGETEDLPAYWDTLIYPANATERQKKQAQREYEQHNAEVSAELARKGFR